MPENDLLIPRRRIELDADPLIPEPARFVELGVASCFSFLRGASDAVDLVLTARALGYDAIGIADANSMAGVVRIHSEAGTLKLRPVIGCRIETVEGLAFLAYPIDRAAYGRLCRLISAGRMGTLDGGWQDKGVCQISLAMLADHSEGIQLILVPPRDLDAELTIAVPNNVVPLRKLESHEDTNLSFEGYLADFFWREMPFMNNGINTSLIRLGTLLTSIWFSVSFLTIRSIFPKVHRGFVFLGWLAVATFLVKLLGARWAEMAFNIVTFITFVSFLAVGSWMYRQGFQSARFYLLGWGVFIIEILAIDLSLLGVLSFDHFFTYYGFHIGATFQVVFLNIALFDRIQSLKIAHNEARALALERSAENEQLLAAQAQLLEQKLEQPQATPTPDMQLLLKEFRHQRQKVRKIAIATMEGILLFPAGDIVRVEAMGSYAYVHFSNKQKILASRSLAEFETQLSEDPSFFRVHKSHIINLDYVTKYIRGAGGYVEMYDGSSVEVSRRNKADFMKTMNLEA